MSPLEDNLLISCLRWDLHACSTIFLALAYLMNAPQPFLRMLKARCISTQRISGSVSLYRLHPFTTDGLLQLSSPSRTALR